MFLILTQLEHGENLIYVSRQLGHAKASITADVYAHLLKERRPDAAIRTDEFLFGTRVDRPEGHPDHFPFELLAPC